MTRDIILMPENDVDNMEDGSLNDRPLLTCRR